MHLFMRKCLDQRMLASPPLDLASPTTTINSNEEMDEESRLLIKGVSETTKSETKKQKGRFFSMLLSTLGASLLGSLLKFKDIIRASEGTIRAGQEF